jgi:glycosyltransferase involved in cell wall biosynthesis
MSPSPRVSILIPAYNPRFFGPCLAGAVAQTYDDVEILVGDDSGGTEIEQAVAAARGGRVRYLRNPARLGFHGNFASLFGRATGEYVKFLNDDDVLEPRCVERMVAAFDSLGPRAALVTSRRQLIDATGTVFPDTAATAPLADRDCLFKGRPFGDEMLLRSVNLVGEPSAAMFRRADVAPVGGTLFRIAEHEYTCLADLALWLRLLAGGSLVYLAEPLCRIRVHAGRLQDSEEVAARCMTERYFLPRDARTIGFLTDDGQYAAALRHGAGLVRRGLAETAPGTRARAICEEAQRQIDRDAGEPPA